MGLTAVAFGARSQSAGATTLTPAKPTVSGTGGVMLAVCQTKNNATHSTSTPGWSQIGSQINSGANFTASLWIAAETAAAPAFTWTGSVACAAQAAYYASIDSTGDTTVGGSANNNGTTSTHSTTGFNTTRSDSLVVYVDVAAANTALATPGTWTENLDGGSATDAGRTVFGSKAVAVSGTGSGNISVTGASAAWVQWQVELMEAVAASGIQSSKVGIGAWLEAPQQLDCSKIEVGVWLDYFGARRRQLVN